MALAAVLAAATVAAPIITVRRSIGMIGTPPSFSLIDHSIIAERQGNGSNEIDPERPGVTGVVAPPH
jgi:hypothetical protein